MELTYRTRRNLKRGAVIALVAALLLTLVWGCWLVWIRRHIVYTRDGAVLDFALTSRDPGEGQLALPPENTDPVSIYYDDDSEYEIVDISLRQVTGYYITLEMLQNDMDAIHATIDALPVGTAVMMDVKSVRGTYYYNSKIEETYTAAGIDPDAVDALIADIAGRNLYFIAGVPAFCDRNFGALNVDAGLPFVGGDGALWVDDAGCYWLDPTSSKVTEYIGSITKELKALGFDEVVFTHFQFPTSPEIEYAGNKTTAIQEAAEKLVEECAGDRFAVSFLGTGSTVKPVTGRSRLYLTGVEATAAASAAAGYTVEDPAVNILFLTDSFDTRYETFSVLRPIDSAITG